MPISVTGVPFTENGALLLLGSTHLPQGLTGLRTGSDSSNGG
jgi:hypothetical protein